MSSSTDDHVVVARIGRPHGVRGEVTVLPDTDIPERFAVGSRFLTDDGTELVVSSGRPYRDRGLVLGFEGVNDRTAAERLRGRSLTIAVSDRRDLDEGEFWPEDLVGLVAVTPEGERLGEIVAVDPGVVQTRLRVGTPDGREVLVPFVSELVDDPADDRIVIRDPGGLFDS